MPKTDAAALAGEATPAAAPAEPAPTPAPTAPAPQPASAAPTWIADEYAGRGGDYVCDPATGQRRPA